MTDTSGPAPGRFARVAPPVPVDGLFTYAVPEELVGRVVPGVRVRVPFGGRQLSAMVVEVGDEPPPDGVAAKPLVGLLEDEPLVGDDILALGSWLARQTGCSVGEALDAALPRAVKSGRPSRTVEEIAVAGSDARTRELVSSLQEKRPKQARALRVLLDHGGRLPSAELMRLAHVSRSPLQVLARAGHVELGRVTVSHDPLTGRPVARTEPLQLTDDQRAVHDRMLVIVDEVRLGRMPPRTVLLHGVTGSGKTEIYLQVLDHVVRGGRQGIVLVPEISLTPQTVRRFRERFERVAVLHSHLTDAERHDQWRRIHRGEADVVVGARSAIFAPVPSLGLVILDEEHETTFKQQNVPRYHAREVAIERARLAGAVTVLGTATPSLEAWHRASQGQYELLRLTERVAGGRTPEIVIVDLTIEERRKFAGFLSDPLRSAMDDALRRGGQVILFLNRRGWANVMLCGACRGAMRCPDCDVSLTLHRRIQRVICHYCGHEQPPPTACPTCGHRLQPLGFGTEKIEQEVAASFPGVRVARMDSDTMSGRGAHETALDSFASGTTQVLVGTQMIAKGLDFANALLVGVICGDSALFLPDYRAAERTFQLLAQVTGRTGRGPQGGRVVVQAYNPHHIAIRTGVAQDMDAFARFELRERRLLGYPPFGRLVRLVAQGPELVAVQKRARELAQRLAEGLARRGFMAAAASRDTATGTLFDRAAVVGETTASATSAQPADAARPPVELLGPAPAPIPRIQRQHRVHLVAKCADDRAVAAVLDQLRGQTAPARQVRVLVDVDPVAML